MSAETDLLGISPDDEAGVLMLNNRHAEELSWLTPEKLSSLLGKSFWARRVGAADAFLIAFDQDAAYDNPNLNWFRRRHARFVYVDRVAVASHARGLGLARRLYEALFAQAVGAGHSLVTCEVNADPPNPASDAFHATLGFSVVGEAMLEGGKRVRYFTRTLP